MATFAVLSVGCRAQAPHGRYLYIVDCDGRVEKLDTLLRRKLFTYDLANRTGKDGLIPKVSGTLDGCLANNTVYLPSSSTFYTVVPEEASPSASGTHSYRVLGFSVPAVELVKQMPAGQGLADPPALAVGPEVSIDLNKAAPATVLDLSGMTPGKQPLPNQILESSGTRSLLRLFTEAPQNLSIAVADRESKKLVRLQNLPPTTALNVHLAPGGGAVLVEVVGAANATTGDLVLYSADTGERLKQIAAPQTKGQPFLAISPNGRAIYRSGEKDSFVMLGRQFGDAPVVPATPVPSPGLFFADR